MKQKAGISKEAADTLVGGIKRYSRKKYSVEEKPGIIFAGLRGEENIAGFCCGQGIAESLYYSWSKEFLIVGKARLASETLCQATPCAPDSCTRRSGWPWRIRSDDYFLMKSIAWQEGG